MLYTTDQLNPPNSCSNIPADHLECGIENVKINIFNKNNCTAIVHQSKNDHILFQSRLDEEVNCGAFKYFSENLK